MKSVKRRTFLKSMLATSAFGSAPFNIMKAGASPNSKLNIAVIGVGKQGCSNGRDLAGTDNNIIALCDVDEPWHKQQVKADRYKMLQGVKLWKDYRVMFDKIGKEIDAVCIATPEHSHYTLSMYAMMRGKHVYCQKPLCHTVNEVRLLTEASKKYKVVTQMGHQGHSCESSAMIRDWVKAGAIGKVREVQAYSRKNYWVEKAPVKGSEIPAGLDWNLFLGRAEEIPYSDSYMKREWIKYSHFSGVVGDMGAHTLDPAYYSLDLGAPTTVRADVPTPAFPGSFPKAGVVTWEFPARGDMPPVTMKYYVGPDIEFPFPKNLEEGRRAITAGICLVGEDGVSITAGSHSQAGRIVPEARMQETPRPKKASRRNKGKNHFQNFTMACKGEDEAMSSFDYAGPLSEFMVLGDIALMNPGVTLKWDSKNMKITNNEEADKSMFMRRLNPRDDMKWF